MSNHNQKLPVFYSRFSLSKSQPYLLTHEYSCNGMKIPGMAWVPDFSGWNINQPDFPSGPEIQAYPKNQGCKVCSQFSGAQCGYEWWTTRRTQGIPPPKNIQCTADVRSLKPLSGGYCRW